MLKNECVNCGATLVTNQCSYCKTSCKRNNTNTKNSIVYVNANGGSVINGDLFTNGDFIAGDKVEHKIIITDDIIDVPTLKNVNNIVVDKHIKQTITTVNNIPQEVTKLLAQLKNIKNW